VVDERTDIVRTVRELLAGQRYATLATQGDGQPYASLVAYVASDDLRFLVSSTMRATRKFGNMMGDARVAVLFDNRANEETDLREAIAATATGAVTVARGEERARLGAMLLARHPYLADFVASPGCALVRVDVDTYHTVVRFQNVYELQMNVADGSVAPGEG
jgi:nitroimidazol reductase NimA-like FMN-containing flavoprotein (pyridoxamine 5'-phosphate oxidase superfamily)